MVEVEIRAPLHPFFIQRRRTAHGLRTDNMAYQVIATDQPRPIGNSEKEQKVMVDHLQSRGTPPPPRDMVIAIYFFTSL